MKTETLRFRTTPEMKAAIEELAAAENTTMSMLIEAAIEKYMLNDTRKKVANHLNDLEAPQHVIDFILNRTNDDLRKIAPFVSTANTDELVDWLIEVNAR
jgi:predicted transcriptional regulator